MPRRDIRSHVRRPAAVPPGLGTILAVTDPGPGSRAVLDRVAQLPLARTSRLAILHQLPRSWLPGTSRRAEQVAECLLKEAVERQEMRMPDVACVQGIVGQGGIDEVAEVAEIVDAEMVVMAPGDGGLAEDFLGSPAERVVRQSRLPVLAVRADGSAPYRRPMLAIDARGALDHLRLLLRILPPPRPRIQVVQACEAPSEALEGQAFFSASEIRTRRAELRQGARRATARALTDALVGLRPLGDDVAWTVVVRVGSTPSILRKTARRSRTDLLALGTRGLTGLAYAFRGTVAGEVLRNVSCDVLLVPQKSSWWE